MSIKFTWLHLTDLHVGQTKKHLWKDFEREVLDDLDRVIDKAGPIDLVFFTGDLVQGGEPAEFAEFEKTRTKIIEALTVGERKPVFLTVPGNHDLKRPTDAGVLITAEAFPTNEDVRKQFWDDKSSSLRVAAANAFEAWSDWQRSLPPDSRIQAKPGMLPGDFAATVTLPGDRRLGVVGLNTTFLQLMAGDRHGKLTVDVRQIMDSWTEDGDTWAKEHDATVLLTHQPPDWLDEPGRDALDQIAPAGRFSVHLFGHDHQEHDEIDISGDQPRIRLLGRSFFGLESYADNAPRLHGYSVGQLEVRRGDAALRLWPRRGEKLASGKWGVSPNTAHVLQGDEGMAAKPAVGGWRQRSPSGSYAVIGRDGAAAILDAALRTAEREYKAMSYWWSDDSPFKEKSKAIALALYDIRDPAEEALLEIRKCVEENQIQRGWSKYARLRGEHLPRISNELLAVIGGLYFARARHDRLGDSAETTFSDVAQGLVDVLADKTAKPRAEILIVGEERQQPTDAEIIRLRFPACDLWNLPFAAHEYGYLVGDHHAPPKLAELQADVKRAVDPAPVGDPPNIDCYLDVVKEFRQGASRRFTAAELETMQKAHVTRLFADAFATYFVGPAYVRSLLLLLRPDDDSLKKSRGALPPFAQRFVFSLETLRSLRNNVSRFPGALEPQSSAALDDAFEQLERTWRDVLTDAGVDDPDLYKDVLKRFGVADDRGSWLDRVLGALRDSNLNRQTVPVFYGWWDEACRVESTFMNALPGDTSVAQPWAVINAAWSLRWRSAADVPAIERRAIELLAGKPIEAGSPIQPQASAPPQEPGRDRPNGKPTRSDRRREEIGIG
jgi:predicted MPP superfamily phosphohydrolase